jgi:Fe/S biogenesis protein NfuA
VALNFIPTLLSRSTDFTKNEFQCFKSHIDNYPSELKLLFPCEEIEEVYVSKKQIKFRFSKTDKIQDCKQQLVDEISRHFENKNESSPLFQHRPLSIAKDLDSSGDDYFFSLKKFITEKISPGLAGHGGSIEVISFQDGQLKVSFGGGCQGCSQVSVTVKDGIMKALKVPFPEVKEIIDLTNHENGDNPYFT